MSRRRLVVIVLSAIGVLVLAVVLYLTFGDLSRHRGRIEAFVARKTGRPFAIDGAFALKVLPSISVTAERVRLGNADGGSAPQMVEVGRFSTEVGLWSLVAGPVDVRSLELRDVSVVLEKGKEGKGNWVLGEGKESAEGQEGYGLARPGRHRGPGRHPERQSRATCGSPIVSAASRTASRSSRRSPSRRARPTSWRSPARAGSAGTRPR